MSVVNPVGVVYVAATETMRKMRFGKSRNVSNCSYPPGAVSEVRT
jgi:hypothetical protein